MISRLKIAALAGLVATLACAAALVVSCSRGPIEPGVQRPEQQPLSVSTGKATWYGGRFHGRKTASGERFNENDFTCAHRKLPFGSLVRVVNLENQQAVMVRVNDRGPYGKGRIIDVSKAAAEKLGMIDRGVVKVRVEVMSKP